MAYINNDVFDFLNITKWHAKGYTGKGVKIGVIEGYVNKDLPQFDGKVFDPLNIGYTKGDLNGHAQSVIDVVHQAAPDAEIYTLPSAWATIAEDRPALNQGVGLEWAIDNGINIISMSLDGLDDPTLNTLYEKALAAGIMLVIAAGNIADTGLCTAARLPYWFSVGACHYINKTLYIARYSSIGPELDAMSISHLNVHDAKTPGRIFPLDGTSFAAPLFAGMLGLFNQYFYSRYARFPAVEDTVQYVKANCMDLSTRGWDINTGYGLFILPAEVTEYAEDNTPATPPEFIPGIVLQIDSSIYKVDGVEYSMDTAPFINSDGRTMVPVRFIAEALGCNVEWIEDTKEIIITKS